MKRIVIAKPARAYADAISNLCIRLFNNAEITVCHTGQHTIAMTKTYPTDLLLLSLDFPDFDAVELLLSTSQNPSVKCLLVFVESRFKSIFTALRTARVNAILDMHSEPLTAIQDVLQKIEDEQFYISPSLKSALVDCEIEPQIKKLSAAEIRVLQVIGTGRDNYEAAMILGLKESTVQTHRRNIMKKINVSSSAKLVHEAVRLGYVQINSEMTV